jgi:hypothetical protein
MNKNSFIIIAIVFFLLNSCNTRDRQAVDLIQKSIEAHGGQEAWNRVQSISMTRDLWLFDENGAVESNFRQENEFRLKPYFEAKMAWEKDSIAHRVHFDGIKTQYWMGANEILNEGFLESKKRDIDAAFYVLTKPFDLLDEGKNLTYEGKTELEGGVMVESVKVVDGNPEDPDTDIWWYYFDPKSFEILAYKVKTSDHYSMVYNQGWDNSSGILLPAKRESYRVDSLGNRLYLRALYAYSDYK